MKKVVMGVILVSLMACSKKESKEEQALKLYSESMAIHDQIMPLMDEMYTLERKLNSIRDSLRTDSVTNSQKLAALMESLNKLEMANKGMMDWMHNIKDVPETTLKPGHGSHAQHGNSAEMEMLTPEAILQIQQEQKSAIELVRAAMENSIEEARLVVAGNN